MDHLKGFEPLAARYDGFILDLWGVVHDGVKPYPGAIGCLTRLRDAGKPVVLLSNAPRRASAAQAALEGMGIGPDLYTGIITSGEATHLALRDRMESWHAGLGPRVFHLGPERDRNVLDGLELTRVDAPEDADFVLNTGPDDERDPSNPAEFDAVLEACLRRDLPMLCANPDLEVIRDGRRLICAGLLAERYAQRGGEVRSLGKPDPAIYAPVLERLGVAPERVLAVGDSLRTDIAGAKAAGVDACWVLGGIHGAALGGDVEKARATAHAAGLFPVASLAEFAW
jgi:HAD superfamily hydrolase (TIGR01459 family)